MITLYYLSINLNSYLSTNKIPLLTKMICTGNLQKNNHDFNSAIETGLKLPQSGFVHLAIIRNIREAGRP